MPKESYSEAYDYEDDEDLEDDEAFEDDEDDEAFEDDEDDEAFEDDEDDEAFEDDEDDESFEDDEDDEAFEDDEMAGEVSARQRRERERARARARAQAQSRSRAQARAQARQQAVARRAKANQASLSRTLKNIHGARKPKTGRIGRVHGSSIVTATLPNGRRTRMRLSPSLASANSVNKLRSQIVANDKRQAKAVSANASAIRKLGKAQADAVKKLTAQQVAADKMLSKRVVDGDTKLDARITKELATVKGSRGKHNKAMMASLKRERRRSLWNGILLTTSLPFFAAYGDVNRPFSYDNLVLTGSLAGWMLGDEIVDRIMGRGKRSAKKRDRYFGLGADAWSYIAPVGNAATVWWLLKDRQHVRFLTNTATVSFTYDVSDNDGVLTINRITPVGDPIRLEVASKYQEEFDGLANVRAVATISNTNGNRDITGVTATVAAGQLTLTPIASGLPRPVDVAAGESVTGTFSIEVAWVVDTQNPDLA